MAESEEDLKNLLMKVNEESEKTALKLNIQKKIMENSGGAESRCRRNRTGDHFLFYKFIERTTER